MDLADTWNIYLILCANSKSEAIFWIKKGRRSEF